MSKNKNYFPNFKVAKPDVFETQPEETAQDSTQTQDSFDDAAFEKDLSDADMGEVTSPETEYTFLSTSGNDVFNQKPTNKKPKTVCVG
eukprot:7175393-Alexandrium_andersonii.AAC.1